MDVVTLSDEDLLDKLLGQLAELKKCVKEWRGTEYSDERVIPAAIDSMQAERANLKGYQQREMERLKEKQ